MSRDEKGDDKRFMCVRTLRGASSACRLRRSGSGERKGRRHASALSLAPATGLFVCARQEVLEGMGDRACDDVVLRGLRSMCEMCLTFFSRRVTAGTSEAEAKGKLWSEVAVK